MAPEVMARLFVDPAGPVAPVLRIVPAPAPHLTRVGPVRITSSTFLTLDKEAEVRAEGERVIAPAERIRLHREFMTIVCSLDVARPGEGVRLDAVSRWQTWSLPMALFHARIAARAQHLTIDAPDPHRWTERLVLTAAGRKEFAVQLSAPLSAPKEQNG